MNHPIPAVFDSGVFRPLEPVDLAEGTRAEVTPLSQPTESSKGTAEVSAWPTGYFEQTAGALADEKFERPLQGELQQRDEW